MADDFRNYDGEFARVRWSKTRCIHAARCVTGLPAVFDIARRPWIAPDAATFEQLATAVHACPTGALELQRLPDGVPLEEPVPTSNTIRLAVDGPLFVNGDLDLAGEPAIRAALCRCGASSAKPYCDGTHTEAGYREPAKPTPSPSPSDPPGSGKLEIRPTADGPLLVTGPFELRDADDNLVARADNAALCRCGASGNPPYCDGSHYGIGFEG